VQTVPAEQQKATTATIIKSTTRDLTAAAKTMLAEIWIWFENSINPPDGKLQGALS
jgi:hypothetical protein